MSVSPAIRRERLLPLLLSARRLEGQSLTILPACHSVSTFLFCEKQSCRPTRRKLHSLGCRLPALLSFLCGLGAVSFLSSSLSLPVFSSLSTAPSFRHGSVVFALFPHTYVLPLCANLRACLQSCMCFAASPALTVWDKFSVSLSDLVVWKCWFYILTIWTDRTLLWDKAYICLSVRYFFYCVGFYWGCTQ